MGFEDNSGGALDLPQGPFDAVAVTDMQVIADVSQAGVAVDANLVKSAGMENNGAALNNTNPTFEV